MNRRSLVVVLAVITFDLVACNDPQRGVALPTSPTAASSGPFVVTIPTPGPGANNATTLQVGQTVTGDLHGNDPICSDFVDPQDTYNVGGPCQAYRVIAPDNGTLTIKIAWDNATNAVCAAYAPAQHGFRRNCLASPMNLAWPVTAGQTYGFGVEFLGTRKGINYTLTPDASQTYTLAASFTSSPAKAAAR